MKKNLFATQLRTKQYRDDIALNTLHFLNDDEVVDKYNTKPNSSKKILSTKELKHTIELANDAEHFFALNKAIANCNPDRFFWGIIGQPKFVGEDGYVIVDRVIDRLMECSSNQIELFQSILYEKLEQLDTQEHCSLEHPSYFMENSDYYSNDGFEYACCGVIAQGESFFNQVKENAKLMLKVKDLENLLYAHQSAKERLSKKFDEELNPKIKINFITDISQIPHPNQIPRK